MPGRSKTRLMGDAITDTAILEYDGAAFEKKSAACAGIRSICAKVSCT